jgi:hypothetical protein
VAVDERRSAAVCVTVPDTFALDLGIEMKK